MPIDIEKLRAVKKIICHGPFCADGRASAMILKQALPNAEVVFMNYSEPAHKELKPEPGLLFCDFSPYTPRVKDYDNPTDDEREALAEADERIRQMVEVGAIALDHHGSQKRVLDMFGDQGVFASEDTDPGVSGASLAFREVWDPICREDLVPAAYEAYRPVVEEFAKVAAVRDTWQNKHELFTRGCEQREALTFWNIKDLLELDIPSWEEKLSIGPVLWANNQRGIRKFLSRGIRYTTNAGTRVFIAPGLSPTSDAAEMLDSYPPDQMVDVLCGFGYVTNPTEGGEMVVSIVFSMRSHTGYRVDQLAKANGGGGHKAAAGFSFEVNLDKDPNPYSLFKTAISAHESEW